MSNPDEVEIKSDTLQNIKKDSNMPHLESFPQSSQQLLTSSLNEIIKASNKTEAEKALQPLKNLIEEERHLDYRHLWCCVTLKDKLKEMGINYGPLTNRGVWSSLERKISKGESVFSHSTDYKQFKDILKQNEIASRSFQKNVHFGTGELKHKNQELFEVSFAWDSHSGRYGKFAFIVPVDVALKDAVFCEADGTHIMSEDEKEGYSYNLNNPYVVIVSSETHADSALNDMGWSEEKKDSWKKKHMVIGDANNKEENAYLGELSQIGWNLRGDYISPIKGRVLDRLKEQGYISSKGLKFYPTGESTDMGRGKTRIDWLYKLQ